MDVNSTQTKQQLLKLLTEQTATLLGTLRSYVLRMGLAGPADAATVANEVLQEVAVEALAHCDRFDPTRQPHAWLLGIGINVIKRRKASLARYYQRELSFTRLTILRPEQQDERESFDQLIPFSLAGPEQEVESEEQARLILSLVSPEDQRVLRLAIVYEFEREALAHELGITSVAARVRLHRALQRLRVAWNVYTQKQQEAEQVMTLERKKL